MASHLQQKDPVSVYETSPFIEIIREHLETRKNLGMLAVLRAAEQDGADIKWFSRRDAWAFYEDKIIPLRQHFGPESVVGSAVSTDKNLTRIILEHAGVSVPKGTVASTVEDAIKFAEELGAPVVTKPLGSSMGRGVTVNISQEHEIRDAFEEAFRHGSSVLVEQYIQGFEYRVHATPTDCVGAFRRLLPNVVGDGESTIQELVIRKNESRQTNPTTRNRPIPVDQVATNYLLRNSRNWNSVPDKGEVVVIRDVNGITSGGDSESCFDSMNESIKQIAVDAVAAIPGMTWAGVDILFDEVTQTPFVIEVNTNASIDGASFPVKGEPMDLPRQLWKELRNHAERTPEATPKALTQSKNPQLILSDQRIGLDSKVPLKQLLQKEAIKRGFQIEHKNSGVWTASKAGHETKWFLGHLTTSDSRISTQAPRERRLLVDSLSFFSVPCPEGKIVINKKQLLEFQNQLGTSVTLLPNGIHPSTDNHKVLQRHDGIDSSIFPNAKGYYAQVRLRGQRVRVIASQHEAFVAIIGPDEQIPNSQQIYVSSMLAVTAVRSVPQLQWATVEIVLPNGFQDSHKEQAYVEDVSYRPRFNAGDAVVGGSMDSLYDFLLSC